MAKRYGSMLKVLAFAVALAMLLASCGGNNADGGGESPINSLFGNIAQTIRDIATLGSDTRFLEDLEAKSVDMVKFSALLEDVFEVEVPFMEFVKRQTFGEAAAYIAEMFGE